MLKVQEFLLSKGKVKPNSSNQKAKSMKTRPLGPRCKMLPVFVTQLELTSGLKK